MTDANNQPFSKEVPFLFGFPGLNFSGDQDADTVKRILDWYELHGVVNREGPKAVFEVLMPPGEDGINLEEGVSENVKRFEHLRGIFEEYNVEGTAILYPVGGSNLDLVSNDQSKREAAQEYITLAAKTSHEAWGNMRLLGPFVAEAKTREYVDWALDNATPHLKAALDYVTAEVNENFILAPEMIRHLESVLSRAEQFDQLYKATGEHPRLWRHSDSCHGKDEPKYRDDDEGVVQYTKDVLPRTATYHGSEHDFVTKQQADSIGGPDGDNLPVGNRAVLHHEGNVGKYLPEIVAELITEGNKRADTDAPQLHFTLEAPGISMRTNLLRGQHPPGMDKASAKTIDREAYATALQCLMYASLAVDKATKYKPAG